MRSTTPGQEWEAALSLVREVMVRDGYTLETVNRTLRHVARFGREVGAGPWQVTPVQTRDWLDGLTCSRQAAYAYATALRVFYREAVRTGRITAEADPMAGVNWRLEKRRPPEGWQAAVTGWLRWLATSGARAATINIRRCQLTRLACELPQRDPWAVEVEDLAEWMAGHSWSRETLHSCRSALRSFYGWAQLVGYMDRNPAAALPSSHARYGHARPAPQEAVDAALGASDGRVRLMVRLAAELGLRRGEIAAVHSRDVVVGTDGGWWLEVHGKGGKPRTLPLSESLAEPIRAADGWLFPGQCEGHLSANWVGKIVSAAMPSGVTAHMLRHRFATQAYAVDQDLLTVQQLLGHASPSTTQRYVSVPPANLRRLVTAVGGV
ncbi:MAG: tyrosine-type recombinase/integrase [Propionibacteriaceae bacterium]|jgi:integrase|nr:tyrosine-type recombinase/integrase [Propionibacteriaceae bacterium]